MKIGGAVAAVVVLVVVAVVVLGGGGSGGGGLNNEQGLLGGVKLQAGPSSEPEEKQWSKDCPGSCELAADSSRVYALSNDDGDSTLTAYAKKDGDKVWSQSIDGSASDVQLVGDRLLVDTTDDDDGVVRAFATSDGKKVWDAKADGASTGLGDSSMILVSDYSGDAARTSAVELSSGAKKWSADGSPIGLCGGYVVLSTYDADDEKRSVVAHGASDGNKKADIDIDVESVAATTCSDDGLFVLEDDEVAAYSFIDSKPRWKQEVTGVTSLTAGSGLVLAVRDTKVRALSASDGEQAWDDDLKVSSASTEENSGSYLFSVGGGKALLMTNSKTVLVRTSDGTKVESHNDGDGIGTPASNGFIDVDGARIQFVTWSDLEEKWSTKPAGTDEDNGIGSVAVGGGQLYVASDGEVLAYR